MKVALISSSASALVGFRRDFILYLMSLGHTVYAFAPDYQQESKNKIESFGAIPVDYNLSRTGTNPLKDLLDMLRLATQLKKIKLDVAFSFFVKPVIYGTLAAKLAGISRRVAMIEGLGYVYTPQKKGRSLKKIFLQFIQGCLYSISFLFADLIIFLNKDDPHDLSRKACVPLKKVKILGGIGLNLNDYPFVKSNQNDSIRFIFVGRLLVEKGIFEYLEAAAIVKNKYPHVEFIILGDIDKSNPASLTQQQLDDVIRSGQVTYPGYVNDVGTWLAKADVFVLPSYREGVPRSTQEAMAMGKAIITTDVPGCRDTVIDGVNGFLVPLWDVKTLSEKMIYFVENKNQIGVMGEKSYEIAQKNYDVKIVNTRLADFVLGRHGV